MGTIGGQSKFFVLGHKSAAGVVTKAASNDDTGAIVFMSHIHHQQHLGNVLKLNDVDASSSIGDKWGYSWNVGIHHLDFYLDPFSTSGKARITLYKNVTVSPAIGTNILMGNMDDAVSKPFDISGTKGPPVASNSVTKLTKAQVNAIIVLGGFTITHDEILGDKKQPGTPSVEFPSKLAADTTYMFVVDIQENLIAVNNIALFNQECF